MMRKLILLAILLVPAVGFTNSTYYTYGNGPMMHGTFNAIAMIFNSSSFGNAVEVVFTMSFAVATAISIFGKRWDFAKYGLISLFILSLFFWQRDTVVVHDVTMSEDYVVDDVPYGYAYVGELISSFGYYITDTFDQAYSVPTTQLIYGVTNDVSSALNYTNVGFAGGYKALEVVKNFELNNKELQGKLVEYIDKCLKYDYSALSESQKQLFGENTTLRQNQYLPNGLRSSFDIPVTISGVTSTCKEYYGTYLNTEISNDVNDTITNIASEPKLAKLSNGMTEAVATFTNMSYTLRDALIQSALIKTSVKGLAKGYANNTEEYYQFLAEYGIEQFKQQSNIMSRFGSEIMPVFKNVMEVLMIAVLPIVLLLFILPNSVKLVGNYFQSLIWIQLWNPILAILNYVIVMAGVWKTAFVTGVTGSAGGFTINNLVSMSNYADTYIAVAGYLMMSVPVLATVVLNGGRWASGALAGGMASAGMSAAAMANPEAMRSLGESKAISDQIRKWNESGLDATLMMKTSFEQSGYQFENKVAAGSAMNHMVNETGKSSWSIQNTNARSQAIDAHAKAVGVQKTAEALGGTTSYVDGVSETNSFNQRAGIAETKDLKDNGFTPERVGENTSQNKRTGIRAQEKINADLDGKDQAIEKQSEQQAISKVADIERTDGAVKQAGGKEEYYDLKRSEGMKGTADSSSSIAAINESWGSMDNYQKVQTSKNILDNSSLKGEVESWSPENKEKYAEMMAMMNQSDANQFWSTFKNDPNKALESLDFKYGTQYETMKQTAETLKEKGYTTEELGDINAREEAFKKDYMDGRTRVAGYSAYLLGAGGAALEVTDPKQQGIVAFASKIANKVESGEMSEATAFRILEAVGAGRYTGQLTIGNRGDLIALGGASTVSHGIDAWDNYSNFTKSYAADPKGMSENLWDKYNEFSQGLYSSIKNGVNDVVDGINNFLDSPNEGNSGLNPDITPKWGVYRSR